MKTQERTAAANHRGSGAAQPVGERLPSAPRERKPALAALAVLLILVGALGATVLVLRAGDRVEVVKITQDVPAGKHVPSSAMKSVMVAADSGVDYVKYSQRDLMATKYRTSTNIVKGSVLVGPMVTDKAGLPEGKVVVGLSLKGGQYPKSLKVGDTVAAYRVGTDAAKGTTGTPGSTGASGGAGGATNLLVQRAQVQDVTVARGDTVSSGDLPVSVTVEQNEAQALAQAASAGEVAVVQVPAVGASGTSGADGTSGTSGAGGSE
ncbi:hypothetical protein [Streptomyces sp. H27-D2]|uniref:hypothetical protein n=1 Tax=Streptomyces sp. H27-D2 TaxID=3046304 RepID=UPI002DBEE711|nr:hypothetical protein [Streptomyces sp. H27-D2]MEC4016501.1 hypothetical protein [Streptomyces sp. H27-D2]